jgi:tRNA (cmo5U34)-methyltransferase
MSEFDAKAREWDKDKMHMERSIAIASEIEKAIPLNKNMKALEYGAGTGILSFLLKDKFAEITLMDSSQEMIKVCEEKVEYYKANYIKPLWLDLEHNECNEKFDLIYNQMVLHHVNDINFMLKKFYSLINTGGYLAIADLYLEDGSFHSPDAKVHWGFEPSEIAQKLKVYGFKSVDYKKCYNLKRPDGKDYPIFLLVAKK